MNDFIHVMGLPVLACLVFSGIHAYLGFHVIARQVIFADLALAQLAVLGAAIALVAGGKFEGVLSYGLSFGLTVIGAVVFSLTRFKRQRVPQEAIIGVVYCFAASLMVLVLSKNGDGDEQVRQSLLGNVLMVGCADIIHLLLLYSVVGIFHFIFRKQFFLVSDFPDQAAESGVKVQWWDFLFYLSLGLVVTSSVKIAGVLLVFSFLIVPAVCALLLSQVRWVRLAIGWAVGAAASLAGLTGSYVFDYPSSASVVCAFGIIFILVSILKKIGDKRTTKI